MRPGQRWGRDALTAANPGEPDGQNLIFKRKSCGNFADWQKS
jgi:hypothetical protein